MVATASPEQQLPFPRVRLPVLKSFGISGYQLYQQQGTDQVERSLSPGMTVIAGVNGLGKTTLLNVLFRTLVGPYDPAKATPFSIGTSSHGLVPWATPAYFRSRVPDGAQNARAHAEIAFGELRIFVERRLTDLTITDLRVNGSVFDATEDEFQSQVIAASRVGSAYDYDFLVRYLVFFLEERVELFWNDRGQIEVLRILLSAEQYAQEMSRMRDQIQQLDSKFRNLRWHANKRRKQLRELEAKSAAADGVAAQVAALQSESSSLRYRLSEVASAASSLDQERSDVRSSMLVRKIELEQVRREYQAQEYQALAALFPDEQQSARYLFSTLIGGSGCIACGNRSSRGEERLRRLVNSHVCPVCESPPGDQERPLTAAAALPALPELSSKIEALAQTIRSLEEQEIELSTKITSLFEERATLGSRFDEATRQLRKLGGRLPPSNAEIDALRAQIALDANELEALEAELSKNSTNYSKMIRNSSEQFTKVADAVSQRFTHYCKSLLSEICVLGTGTYRDQVGQEYSYEHPCFTVFMTSSTSPQVPTQRKSREQVSESQREFIDLAFRMALIDVATEPKTGAMLVIETPEASLDGLFIDKAGEMLRAFSQDPAREGNVVILTSNLNRQNLISAALGFTEPEPSWPSADETRDRVINLLQLAAENGALRQNRPLYESILSSAVKGRI